MTGLHSNYETYEFCSSMLNVSKITSITDVYYALVVIKVVQWVG
jgi:hypothetical protein